MYKDPKPNLSQAGILANALYYQALADRARASHEEYLRARDHWQTLFKMTAKKVDTQS